MAQKWQKLENIWVNTANKNKLSEVLDGMKNLKALYVGHFSNCATKYKCSKSEEIFQKISQIHELRVLSMNSIEIRHHKPFSSMFERLSQLQTLSLCTYFSWFSWDNWTIRWNSWGYLSKMHWIKKAFLVFSR